MAHLPDVQKQQDQQVLQEQSNNILYIQQESQNFRNQNFSCPYEGQNNLINNQTFQQQNGNSGHSENHYPFVSNGNFSPSNSSATVTPNGFGLYKGKNGSTTLRNSEFLPCSELESSSNDHQRSDAAVQFNSGNYQPVDLQNINYQQTSHFFLPNIGNQYQLNDILVPTYQSSGSSESSDESSISNASQQHYPSDSNNVINNHFQFPLPIPTTNQVGQNFQQKDYFDNYMGLLQLENQIPRCDSSKSEAAESTCSSLSSGSAESQSENENVVRVPVLVNPVLNNNSNCNVLHSYQNNTHSNINSYSDQMHHNQANDIVVGRNFGQSDQNVLKCSENYTSTISPSNDTSSNGGIYGAVSSNNQINNFVVMLPNQMNKNIQNCLSTNEAVFPNPSSSDMLNSSNLVFQNQKLLQQKLFGLIDGTNQIQQEKISQEIQINKSNSNNSAQENFTDTDDHICSKNNENENLDLCNFSKESERNNCNFSVLHSLKSHRGDEDILNNNASQIQNTSDSSVINSNFINNFSTKSIEVKDNSAMFLKETSDKSINQCVSDVNSSAVDSNSVYLIKNNENDIVKNVCYNESSATSCVAGNSSVNVLPVPIGWRRLLVDGSVIYLSPSNIALSSIEQVKMYLQTIGTCKCGLECPVNCDSVFNFNPKVISRPWDPSDSDLTRLCNHKRKASVPGSSVIGVEKSIKLSRKEIIPTKRKKKKHGSSGSCVSVSQLLAQRDKALAVAAARWSANNQIGNVNYQSMPTNQYQGFQILRNQTTLDVQPDSFESKNVDAFKQETPPARTPDDKPAHFPCINIINNSEREGTVFNINGVNQLLPDNPSAGHELMRSSQMNLNSLVNQRQETGQGMINNTVNYNQPNQEFLQNTVMTPKTEGVMLTPQGMLFPPGMIMQRPRSVPPWHQTRLNINRKPLSEAPVMYERVPYIQHHMPPPSLVFDDVTSRKKHRTNVKVKKASQNSSQNQPSFMENPSAYLAQQTALLHNTISRPNFNITPDTKPMNVTTENIQNLLTSEVDTSTVNSNSASNILLPSKSSTVTVRPLLRQKPNQNNSNQALVCQKNILGKIDSGDVSSETKSDINPNLGGMIFNNHVCSNTNCNDCKKSCLLDNHSAKESHDQRKINEKVRLNNENLEHSNSGLIYKEIYGKNKWRRSGSASGDQLVSKSEENNSVEENPVTSSTEKAPVLHNHKIISDSRPIQGGTVSTSNGSPQPQASPNSSVLFRQEISSPKTLDLPSPSPANGNVLISSTNSSFTVSNSVCPSIISETDTDMLKLNNSLIKDGAPGSKTLRQFGNLHSRSVSPEGNQKYKSGSANFINATTYSDPKFQSNSESSEEQIRIQTVSSSFDFQKEDNRKDKNNEVKGNRFVRTMASGHTVSSNTITSVQAGKTQTATVSVNNSTTPPTTVSFLNFSSQMPLALKGTKSPLEMVQSVVSSIQTSPTVVKHEIQPNVFSVNKTVLPTSTVLNNLLTTTANINTSILASSSSNASVLKTSPGGLQTGHIFVSGNGQYIVASSGNVIPQTNLSSLKLNQTSPVNASPVVTSVAGAVTQVLPAVGVAQQVLGQPTVLVNTLSAPFVIQPGVMAVDTGLGRLAVATGNVLQSSLIESNALRSSLRGITTPEKVKNKKGNKKRKNQVTSLVQMTSPNNVILNQPFSQQNFALSPGGSVQPLQALTFVQGKHGTPTQIVMNNQNNFNNFNPQPQQINLLQPVNLASVPNFPAFQQFIVPGLGNMVMSTDGTTTILPDTNIGVQLQLQNVNGQNVLTPVQNTSFINGQGILTAPAGMLIRAPNNQQKIIQNNTNPQFLSPNNSQFLMNQFQGQLSPLITANLSPNQQIFTNSPPRQSPQEFIQIMPTSSSQNTTVVQQNTTIVQQQTTMVSNNQNILNNSGKSNFILNNTSSDKPIEVQIVGTSNRPTQQSQSQSPQQSQHQQTQGCLSQEKVDIGTQHSVSTQTMINKEDNSTSVVTNNTFCQTLNSNWSGSPPDTTTHSPLESEANRERTRSPSTEEMQEDCLPQAMVQFVSSSINEAESESEAYLLRGIPKFLNSSKGGIRSNDKGKDIVESSTILQEAGVQIQMRDSFVSSRLQRSTIDDGVVSSHSDSNLEGKHLGSQSCIKNYEENKARFVDALLAETRATDLDQEEITELEVKLTEGDLVWGPVRGFPAWPGKLVGPIGSGGKALVRWFGGHCSPTRVNVSQLQTLSQGLEAHHRASNKGRKNRRLNIELEAAIQEAMLELDKITAQQKKISSGSGRPRRSHR